MSVDILKEQFNSKVIIPIVKLLKQGITPEKLTLSLVLGIVFGLLPLVGVNCIICTAFALGLRLNFIAIQLGNLVVTPFYFLMFIPFIRLGEQVFGLQPVPLSVHQIIAMFNQNFFGTMQILWQSNLAGVFIWFVASIPLSLIIYYAILPAMRNYAVKLRNNKEVTGKLLVNPEMEAICDKALQKGAKLRHLVVDKAVEKKNRIDDQVQI